MILDVLEMILFGSEHYNVDIPSLLVLLEKENQYNSLFYFRNQPFFLLEFCCQSDFISALFNYDVSPNEISTLYSHLFHLTSPLTMNKSYNRNRCHWIAKCFHLKDYHLDLLNITLQERIQQDIFGYTPLHYAYQTRLYYVIPYFSHPMVWLKNNKGQSIELLNHSQGVSTVTTYIHDHYVTQIEKIAQRYHLSPLLISCIRSKLGIDIK